MAIGVQNGKKGIGHSDKASAPNQKPSATVSDGAISNPNLSAKKRSELRRRQRREEERRRGLARGTLTPANDKPKTCNTWKKGRGGGKSTKKESERRRLRRRKFEEILGLPRGALGNIDILANTKWSILGVTRTFGIQDRLVERKLQEFHRGVENGRRANIKRDAHFENPPRKRQHVNPPSQNWSNNGSKNWNNHSGNQNWNNSGGHQNRNNYQNGYRNSGPSTFSGPRANRGGHTLQNSRGRGRNRPWGQNHDRQKPSYPTHQPNVRNNYNGISRGRGRQDFHRNSRGRGNAYHQQNYGVNRGPPNGFNHAPWNHY